MNDVSSFIPKEAVSIINQWLNRYKCKLIISKPRKTKLETIVGLKMEKDIS